MRILLLCPVKADSTPEGCKAKLTYVTCMRTGWELNPWPVNHTSNALTTAPPCNKWPPNSTTIHHYLFELRYWGESWYAGCATGYPSPPSGTEPLRITGMVLFLQARCLSCHPVKALTPFSDLDLWTWPSECRGETAYQWHQEQRSFQLNVIVGTHWHPHWIDFST